MNTLYPTLGLFALGGGEIILLLILFVLLPAGVAVVALIAYFATRSGRKPPGPPQSFSAALPPVAGPPRDLEAELRALAKLKDDGLITEEDFNLKKKALLGI